MRIGDTEFVTSESEVHKRNSLVIEHSKGLWLCNSEAKESDLDHIHNFRIFSN